MLCLLTYGEQHDMEFYRYGGEEFVAVAHEQDAQRLARSFENIVRAVEVLQIPIKDGVVTLSQGVYFLANDTAEDDPTPLSPADEQREGKHLWGMRFQQYLSKADAALYTAKEQGRNQTVFAE